MFNVDFGPEILFANIQGVWSPNVLAAGIPQLAVQRVRGAGSSREPGAIRDAEASRPVGSGP